MSHNYDATISNWSDCVEPVVRTRDDLTFDRGRLRPSLFIFYHFAMESGAVGLVLRLSRVMGVAPYPRGSRVRVSKALIVYGFILVTFISFYLLSGTCLFIMKQKPPLLARDITQVIINLITMTLVLFGANSAQGRMRHMARSLKQLEQINKEIPYIEAIPKDHITFWLIVGFIFGNFIVNVIETITFVTSKKTWTVYFIIYFLEQSLVVLLEMQLVAFAARILLTLEMINKSLQHSSCIQSKYVPRMYSMNRYRKMPKVAWEMAKSEGTPLDVNNAINMSNVNKNNLNIFINKDILGTNEAERTEYMIRQLAVYYRHISDIIRTWTSSDGLLMALILLSHMFHMLLLLHMLIIGLTPNSDILLTLLLYWSINSIKHVMALVLFVEPFQRTHIQMERTCIIVQTLKCNCGEYRPLRNELDLFLRMLNLQKASYSPLAMCTLGRPLVFKIFGGLFTYVMVILTYGPETRTPSLLFTSYS